MSGQSFRVGLAIDCMDGNYQKWYAARIKRIEPDRVLVAWCDPRWRHSKYDQWVIKLHYDIRIRPSSIKAKNKKQAKHSQHSWSNRAYNWMVGGDNNNSNQGNQIKLKHIDDWTSGELLQWICNLPGVSPRTQKQLIITIQEEGITGKHFNTSVNCPDDVQQAFPLVSKGGIKNIYAGLQSLRYTMKAYDIKSVQRLSNDPPNNISVQSAMVDDHHNKNTYFNSMNIKHNNKFVENQPKSVQNYRIGQQIYCKIKDLTSKKWYGATIKKISDAGVVIQWDNPNWKAAKYDQFIESRYYTTRIKRKTNEWRYKHIDEWNCDELIQWIIELNLTSKNEEIMIDVIGKNQIYGADMDTLQDIEDITDSFPDIDENTAQKLYHQLEKARQCSEDVPFVADGYDENEQNEMNTESVVMDEYVDHNQNEISMNERHGMQQKIEELSNKLQIMKTMKDSLESVMNENEKQQNTMKKEYETQINTILQENKELKQGNVKQKKQISKLMNEQKEMKLEIENLKQENTQLKLKTINIKNYSNWSANDVVFWILSLENGRYKKYTTTLKESLVLEGITGNDIVEIQESNLKDWGILNFRDRKDLLKQIKKLSIQPPNDH